MNRLPPSPDAFDNALRQLQRHADGALSATTLARLRQARRQAGEGAPARRRHHGWWLATACSAVLATTLALGFHRLNAPDSVSVAAVAQDEAGFDDDTLLFDESPELYLWLGSDGALAME